MSEGSAGELQTGSWISFPERIDSENVEELLRWERQFVAGEETELKALAVSGGGIRSAAFGMGVLQALVAGDKLKEFHYLSTVSGGGYLGSSLTWFLKQGLPTANGDPVPAGTSEENFPFGARGRTSRRERAQNAILDYIRQHASYLKPTPSLNMVSLAAVVLRSSFVSLVVYFCLLTAIMGACWRLGLFDALPQGLFGSLDGFLQRVPNVLLLLALFVVALLAWSSLVYSVVVRLDHGTRSYTSRTFIQRIIGRVSGVAITLAVLGSLPLVHDYLDRLLRSGNWSVSLLCGSSSTALGAVLGMFEGGSQTSGGARSALAKLRPYAAVLLLLSGLLLSTLAVAAWLLQRQLGWTLVGIGLFGWLLGWVSNINYLGLHRMYRDRLMELFLPAPGAVVHGKWRLAPGADVLRLDTMCGVPERRCKRPYHLINANVVLIDSNASDFRARGGDSFILSPLYCGSRATGWVRSDAYMSSRGRGMTLSSAMAVSGAAVNPNTGVAGRGLMRNRLVSMLLTALNLRLGYWATNPKHERGYVPNFISPGLVAGFLGRGLHEGASLVELTDGGHFENLGLYELVRRRVTFILVLDAGADPQFDFTDLANAVERARVDFGAKIDFSGKFPLGDLLPGSGPKQAGSLEARYQLAACGFAEGTIRYPGDEPDQPTGRIVYIKSTLIPNLPPDVLSYKAVHPSFPHESTGDQFFDEQQFEAYRELGYHIGWQWLESLMSRQQKPDSRVVTHGVDAAS